MCGIVGYVGKRPVQDLLLEGLTRLEYRGYDSAGISMIAGDAIDSVRAVGNLEHLRDAVSARADEARGSVATATRTATTGIGHTRWATHGRVNEENAHPHFDTADRVHIVVNGIVENYLSMRERLTDMGAVFTERDRRRGHRPPDRPPHGDRLRCSRPCAPPTPSSRATTRSSRCRSTSPRRSSARARSARSSSVAARARPSSPAPSRLPARDAPGPVHRERRDRRDHARGHDLRAARRHRARARDRRDRLGRGDRREGRLRDLHAQGDPRAGRRGGRDDRRPHRPLGWRRPRRRGRSRRGVAARRQADHRRRLRHELPRRPHRALRDRGVGAPPGGDGHRLRVPLPQPGRRPRRSGHRHHAVGRDRRHAGGDAHRPGARRHRARADQHHGLAGHTRRRRACSSRAPGSRSASRPRRPSPARSS